MEEASAVTYSIGASIAVFFRCHPHRACAARSIMGDVGWHESTALSSEQTERSSSDRSLVHISLPLGRAQPPGSAASARSSPPVAPVGTRAEAAQQAKGGVNLGQRVAGSLGEQTATVSPCMFICAKPVLQFIFVQPSLLSLRSFCCRPHPVTLQAVARRLEIAIGMTSRAGPAAQEGLGAGRDGQASIVLDRR
jgi:hypothetical protein